MLNVYDILLNLLDGERVYESFEWSNKDNIEHIKKIPMVKVSSNFLDDAIYNTIIIDNKFLKDIYKKSEIYNNDKVSVIDYAALFTDGYKVLGIEFNDEGKSMYKSFLLLDEEDEILDISSEIKLYNLPYKKIKCIKNNSYLTREEEFRKNYLLKEIKYAYKKKKYEKINYLYDEIYPKNDKDITDKYKILIKDIENNYSVEHNELYKILRLVNSKKRTTSN